MLCNTNISFLAFDLSWKKNDVIIVKELWINFMFVEYDNLEFVTRLSEPKMFISTGFLQLLLNMDIEVWSYTSYSQGFSIVDDLIAGVYISLKSKFTMTVAFLFEDYLINPDGTFMNFCIFSSWVHR